MATPIVKPALASDEKPIIAAITLAFSTDPAARWTLPNPSEYLRNFPDFIKAFGGAAFAHQSAYYVGDRAGAALWLPPGVQPDEGAFSTLLERAGSAQVKKDCAAVFEQMERYHPREPHWYLPFLAVDPLHQGEGYGSALMQHTLAPCDRDQTLAYLESSNPKNIPLYERHGFKLLATIQSGSSPPIFPMLRKPQARSPE